MEILGRGREKRSLKVREDRVEVCGSGVGREEGLGLTFIPSFLTYFLPPPSHFSPLYAFLLLSR
jgi:hypothetical protein